MLRMSLGWLNTNLPRRKLMCIVGIYNGIVDLVPFTSLEVVIQGLSKSLHYAITYAFSHTTSNAPQHGRDIE